MGHLEQRKAAGHEDDTAGTVGVSVKAAANDQTKILRRRNITLTHHTSHESSKRQPTGGRAAAHTTPGNCHRDGKDNA